MQDYISIIGDVRVVKDAILRKAHSELTAVVKSWLQDFGRRAIVPPLRHEATTRP
jgi:hypothetical protein